MAIPHAAPGELIDIKTFGPHSPEAESSTLIREEHLEVFRFMLPAGKTTPEHTVPGATTIQCLQGSVELDALGRKQVLRAGHLVYLAAEEPHVVTALEDSALLITILLKRV
jgi:quercetin dioxygenase-like cupin family protein